MCARARPLAMTRPGARRAYVPCGLSNAIKPQERCISMTTVRARSSEVGTVPYGALAHPDLHFKALLETQWTERRTDVL